MPHSKVFLVICFVVADIFSACNVCKVLHEKYWTDVFLHAPVTLKCCV